MPFKKGQGGRKPGSKNASTLQIEELARKVGVNPLEVLLRMAAGDWQGLGYEAEMYFIEKPDGAVKAGYVISPQMRLDAAGQATRYFYSPKQAVEVSGELGLKIIVEDYTSEK
jgi:hypothetical protein